MPGTTQTLIHPTLGKLAGLAKDNLIHFYNLPYGKISQRFARASLVQRIADHDGTSIPPASVQPFDSGKMDCKGNQLPADVMDGYAEEQSEDCLNLNVIVPDTATATSLLPVLVFVHGGAFFIGASTRPYYDPSTMCKEAIRRGTPHIFVSMNYRLGGLGFFHSPEAEHLMPANNGLHDQRIGYEWIHRFIGGFGGDTENITAMGQSAGGMSTTIHNLSGKENVWKRSIQFSGSLVTMPVKAPKDHQDNFLVQAEKLGLDTKKRSSEAIASEMISVPVSQIRDLNYVGLPCSSSELLPYPSASMAFMSKHHPQCPNLESQIISSTTYDGGISYNLMISNPALKNHAEKFTKIINNTSCLSDHGKKTLLTLYDIQPTDPDPIALRKICQFESEVGFFLPTYFQALASARTGGKVYLLLFDLGNPFSGYLSAFEYATHTWDIVALLGSCEDRLDNDYKQVIGEFRERVLRYVVAGEEPWAAWTEAEGKTMVVGKDGLRVVGKEEYMGRETRRGKLLTLAGEEAGEGTADLLWDGLCRRFLMGGD
jgi:carboxylesterase type B